MKESKAVNLMSLKKTVRLLLVSTLVLLLVTQIAFIIYTVSETYIAGPVQDSWGLIPYIEKTLSSHNWFSTELWTPQNSHRITLVRIEYLIDYSYFHGSNLFLIALAAILILIESYVIAKAMDLRVNSDYRSWVTFLMSACLFTHPAIAWTFLHIFNIQMLECAVLVCIACLLFLKGLHENNYLLFYSGILVAIICNFVAFSISTIWPAFILLLFLSKASKKQKYLSIGIILFFCYIYLSYLPTEAVEANKSSFFHTVISLFTSSESLLFSFRTYLWLFKYLIDFLSLPVGESTFFKLLTLFSLGWFIYSCWRVIKTPSNTNQIFPLSLMCFGVFFGLSVGLGRGYLGDLALGPRFQPIALVYWSGFITHLLLYLREKNKSYLSDSVVLVFVITLVIASVNSALETGKQLTEDYTRFAKMQMGYISNNLGENAIYENMVPEWRKTSYPGIVAAIPFLQKNKLGIFNQPIAQFIEKNRIFSAKNIAPCTSAVISEKFRNEDPLIRNIFVETKNSFDQKNYRYLLVYTHNELVGAAFRQRLTLLQRFKSHDANKSTWIGLIKHPVIQNDSFAIAFHNVSDICRMEMSYALPR